jgi:hypothetical protein
MPGPKSAACRWAWSEAPRYPTPGPVPNTKWTSSPSPRANGRRARAAESPGEAKATVSPRGLADVERLEHIRALLAEQGHRTQDAVLALFSLHGFDRNLLAAAEQRSDLLLVELDTLYGQQPGPSE